MSLLFEAKHIIKNFGGVKAIDDFSLELKKDGIHGLIGPNGAGKTTLFNCITGVYKPEGGQFLLDGVDITGKRPDEAALLGIARTFQNIRLFSRLSVLENVIIGANVNVKYHIAEAFLHSPGYRKVSKKTAEYAENLLLEGGLESWKDQRADSLPYGHQRRLEILRAIAIKPRLLLLDEPAAGMNEDEEKELVEFILRVKEKFGLSILLIEHHMDVVTNLCGRCTVLNFGKTLTTGTPEEIKKNQDVIDAYLGGAD